MNTFISYPRQNPNPNPNSDDFSSQNLPKSAKIEITNSKIIHFYNSHPDINIDEINLYFINLINNMLPCEKKELSTSNSFNLSNIPLPNIHDIQHAHDNKEYFTSILSKIFTNADIANKFNNDNYNFICMKRLKKPKVLIKNIDIESNLSDEDVSTFTSFIDQENCCGIILSQNSGISNKNHFQIDIHNNNIIVFLHNVKYSQSVIISAIDIIDNLFTKIQEFSKFNTDCCNIPKELLDNINNEYQLFIIQKNTLVNIIKDYQKKLLSQLDECRFSSLNGFLSEKYSTPIQKTGYNCELCSNYSAHNLKALAAHKRGCIRKKTKLNN